jgi:multidrug efflux pump subunit AcrA (membrane-fusion protein)
LSANFAGADRSWQGRVVRTEGEIDSQSRMVHIVARVDDPYRIIQDASESGQESGSGGTPLAVGLFVEAEIFGRSLEDVVVLPRSAMREDDRVLVVNGEDQMYFRSVEVLRWEKDAVVIGSGLNEGERVCVSPIRAVVEGMKVRAADVTPRLSVVGDVPAASSSKRAATPNGAES